MKKRLFVLSLCIVSLFTMAGCGDSASPAAEQTEPPASQEAPETPSSTSTETDIQKSPDYQIMEPIVYTGSGDQVIRDVNLDSGLHVVHTKHNGSRNFIVSVYDGNGDRKSSWANEIGIYEGSCIFTDPLTSGFLEVTASGDWEITISSLEAEGTSNLTGSGDCVTPFFPLDTGALIVTSHHDGEHNFIVSVYDETGKRYSSITNEIGIYDGETIFNEGKKGTRFCLEITASGNWSVDFGLGDAVTVVSNQQ